MVEEIKLDLKDRKILYELDRNSRQSNSNIAKKVGLSKEVVNYRIKNLEKIGIIEKYYTIIDISKIGYINFRVYLKFFDLSNDTEKKIRLFLINNKSIGYVAKIDGNFDLNFWVIVKNIYEFEEFYQSFKLNFRKFIEKDKIAIFTNVYHFNRAYLLDKKSCSEEVKYFGGRTTIFNLDKTNSKILKLISNNSRISLVEMSKKLNIPERTISFRIKNLEKNRVIQGYRVLINLRKLGYEIYKVDIFLKDISNLDKIKEYAHFHPNIVYINQTIGGSDFEIDIEVKNKQEFEKIIDKLKEEFSEIRKWNYFTIREYYKESYFPEN